MAGLEGYPELRGKFSASGGQQSGMDPFEQRSSSASMSPRSVNFEMLFWCLQTPLKIHRNILKTWRGEKFQFKNCHLVVKNLLKVS